MRKETPEPNRWHLWVDEAGRFSDADDTVVVAGLLLPDREAFAPHKLRSALKRACPFLPWPWHTWLVNQPAFMAIIARVNADDAPQRLVEAADAAWRFFDAQHHALTREVMTAIRRQEPEREYRDKLKLLSAALSAAQPDVADTLSNYGREIVAGTAAVLAELRGSNASPVRMFAAGETITGDAWPVDKDRDRYLVLHEQLLERVWLTLIVSDGPHHVTVWSSRRDARDRRFGADVTLSAPLLQQALRERLPQAGDVKVHIGGVITAGHDPMGGGAVAADLAANTARLALRDGQRPLRDIEAYLHDHIAPACGVDPKLSYCAATGDAAALIAKGCTVAPEVSLPWAGTRRARWACEQAWAWAAVVHP